MQNRLTAFIFLAGIAQIGLVTGSLAIPAILKWRLELTKVSPLIRQMFWTYAAYILVINLCFGLVSVCCPGQLTNGTTLALLCDAFIAVYWVSRILVQFFYFDRASFPKGAWFSAGEAALVVLFVFLSLVYSCAGYFNFQKV
jgi:hypothetical protein